ncbi:MAG: HD-GYP domain-containing protein [Chloroflexota bacterium]|nr:HD-GYP domain-containing protein [Chloroflexota bacterium]
MMALPTRVYIYIFILFFIALFIVGYSLAVVSFSYVLLVQMIIFALATLVGDLFPIVLPSRGNAEITVSCIFKTAAAMIFGPWVTVLITLLGTLMAELVIRREWYKLVFNVSEMVITSASLGLGYHFLCDGRPDPFASPQNAAAAAAIVLIYILINVGLMTGLLSLLNRVSFAYVYRANFQSSIWNNLTLIPIGALLAHLWLYQPWSVMFLVLPIVVVRQSFQFIGELQEQTRQTLIRMADAIDQRDPSTYQHSRRVASISRSIARELGLSEDEAETIFMAGRLHDLGKIGMSNNLLYKPGRFTQKERAEFRRHPAISAELLESFRLFEEGRALVLHHHERWDGKGYPAGIAGEEIPLGSRIICVADSFDAMISWRPYRSPLSLERAMREITENKGAQFDPQVVDAFARVMEKGELEIDLPIGQPSLSKVEASRGGDV